MLKEVLRIHTIEESDSVGSEVDSGKILKTFSRIYEGSYIQMGVKSFKEIL